MKTSPAHDATIYIRLPQAAKDALQQTATAEMMSVSDYVRKQLYEASSPLSANIQQDK